LVLLQEKAKPQDKLTFIIEGKEKLKSPSKVVMRWKRSYFIQKFVLKLKRKRKAAEQIEIKDVFQNWRIEILPKVFWLAKTKSKLSLT
jgi:hypothetical protein